MTKVSRREFVALAATATGAAPFVLSGETACAVTVTAQDIVDRIKQQLGVPWKAETLDTFKAYGKRMLAALLNIPPDPGRAPPGQIRLSTA